MCPKCKGLLVFGEEYDVSRLRTKQGVLLTLVLATVIIFFVSNPFQGLILSQMLLSIQLPWTILLQIRLTSSTTVMGRYANQRKTAVLLWLIGLVVTLLNVMLLKELLLWHSERNPSGITKVKKFSISRFCHKFATLFFILHSMMKSKDGD